MRGNKLGDKVGNHQGKQAGRQGGSGSQEQPEMEIVKRDKLGRQGGSGKKRAAQNGDHEGRQAWETRRQRHHGHLAISGISNPVIET